MIDVEAAPLADVVARVREVAAERGVEVGASELVGLLPESAVAEPACSGSTRCRTSSSSSDGSATGRGQASL